MFEYYIVGDYKLNCGRIESCLISVCGTDKEHAERSLARTLANPPSDCLGNIQLKSERKEQCWWNMGRLD